MTNLMRYFCSLKKFILDFSQESRGLPTNTVFNRLSTALRVNILGALLSVGIDVARFGYAPLGHGGKGLLIEPEKTNFTPYSVFTSGNCGLYGITIIGANENAPNGSVEGSRITESVATQQHYVATNSMSFYSGVGSYCASVFVKAGTQRYIQLTLSTYRFPSQYITFDLNSVAVVHAIGVSNGSIEDYGNGWFRVSAVFTCTSSGTSGLYIGFCDSSTITARLPSYAGGGNALYLWGAQVEIGTTATSHIPTAGLAATRAADQLQFTIPSWVRRLRYTFDDGSQQTVVVSPGAYTVPTTLNRSHILRIQGTS